MDDLLTESYAIWERPDASGASFVRQLDRILSPCVYYPEEEWSTYNYRPPEDADLIGAWRTQLGEAFVFLLAITKRPGAIDAPDYRVLLTGSQDFVRTIGRKIVSHKGALENIQRRELSIKSAKQNFAEEVRSQSLQKFSTIVGVFAVLVNAFSLYLRTLPIPKFPNDALLTVYHWVIVLIHFGALSLLLLTVIVAIAYVMKFGLLLVRRRR